MNRTVISLAILLAAVIPALAQSVAQSDDERMIRQYLREVDAMLVQDQPGTWQQFAAADVVIVTSNGVRRTRAEQIEGIRKAANSFTALKRNIGSIRVMGDVAVVVSHINFTSANRTTGETINGGIHNTAMLAKRGGKWTTISTQSTRDEPRPDEGELNRFMDSYAVALTKNSADEAGNFLARDYVHVEPDGAMTTKDGHLAALRSGDLKFQSIDTTDRLWRFTGFGSVAILTSRLRLKVDQKEHDISGTYRLTTVLRRAGDYRWLITSTHISPLAGH